MNFFLRHFVAITVSLREAKVLDQDSTNHPVLQSVFERDCSLLMFSSALPLLCMKRDLLPLVVLCA